MIYYAAAGELKHFNAMISGDWTGFVTILLNSLLIHFLYNSTLFAQCYFCGHLARVSNVITQTTARTSNLFF